jgi:hypothetical protein
MNFENKQMWCVVYSVSRMKSLDFIVQVSTMNDPDFGDVLKLSEQNSFRC